MIPITVIAGYLGAGKTHLVNRLLQASSEPIGVCVNDFGELNIDAALIQNRSGTTLELTNGCVCCQLTDDLGAALESLRSSDIKRVIIEASGVALPEKIAAYGHNWPGYQLQKTYTLVDASNIQSWLRDKYVGALVKTQIQQADELLITKVDLVSTTSPTHWPWLRDHQTRWQLLPAAALSTEQSKVLLALEPNRTPSAQHQAEAASNIATAHTQNFLASCHPAKEPISEAAVREFLRVNPQIVRAKGWFTDSAQQQFVLQHVGEQTRIAPLTKSNIEPDTQPNQNGLVFLHHKSLPVDLQTLTNHNAEGIPEC